MSHQQGPLASAPVRSEYDMNPVVGGTECHVNEIPSEDPTDSLPAQGQETEAGSQEGEKGPWPCTLSLDLCRFFHERRSKNT